VKLRQLFNIASFALIFLAGIQAKAEDCLVGELRSNLAGNDALKRVPALSFATWNMDHLPTLQAKDFLPAEFLDTVKKELGPVRFKIIDHTKDAGKFRGYESAYFEVATSRHAFARWTVIFDRKNPEKVEITGLTLENPLAEGNSANLRASQKKKGLPAPVFNFAREKLMDLFRAGGFKSITAVPENYAVSLLYRRFVQFSPSNQSAVDRYQYVDKLFQYARTSLPQDVSVRSADDFSKILGGPSDPIPDSLIEVENLWLDRWKKKMPKELVPFGDSHGNLLGLIDRRKKDAKPAVYFFDPSDPNGYFLRWSSLVEKLELDLKKNLN
jgi:hypothetical protein